MLITTRDWLKLTDKLPAIAETKAELEKKLRDYERRLKSKGYQKSANKHKFYATMDDGLVPFNTAKQATAARHAEVKKNIRRIKRNLAKLK